MKEKIKPIKPSLIENLNRIDDSIYDLSLAIEIIRDPDSFGFEHNLNSDEAEDIIKQTQKELDFLIEARRLVIGIGNTEEGLS